MGPSNVYGIRLPQSTLTGWVITLWYKSTHPFLLHSSMVKEEMGADVVKYVTAQGLRYMSLRDEMK